MPVGFWVKNIALTLVQSRHGRNKNLHTSKVRFIGTKHSRRFVLFFSENVTSQSILHAAIVLLLTQIMFSMWSHYKPHTTQWWIATPSLPYVYFPAPSIRPIWSLQTFIAALMMVWCVHPGATYTLHCALHTITCSLYSVHFTLCTVEYNCTHTLCAAHCTGLMHNVHAEFAETSWLAGSKGTTHWSLEVSLGLPVRSTPTADKLIK